VIEELPIPAKGRLTILASFVVPATAMVGIALSRREYPLSTSINR
jgi:hypothetical protein